MCVGGKLAKSNYNSSMNIFICVCLTIKRNVTINLSNIHNVYSLIWSQIAGCKLKLHKKLTIVAYVEKLSQLIWNSMK